MIYQYKCEKSHIHFEHRVVADRNKKSKCPECGKNCKLVVTTVPAVFKGSGFPSHDARKTPFPFD